jgi:hypothetical protein
MDVILGHLSGRVSEDSLYFAEQFARFVQIPLQAKRWRPNMCSSYHRVHRPARIDGYIQLMNRSSFFTGPFQGLVTGSLGAFFVKTKEETAAQP